MYPDSKEIALAIVRARTEVLDPHYEELRQQFLGSIASADLTNRQQELQHSRDNARLVEGAVALLPGPTRDLFRVGTVAEAKFIQANVLRASGVLGRFDYNDSYHRGFYYEVGRRPTATSGVAELLLQPAKGQEVFPQIVPVLKEDLRSWEQAKLAINSNDNYTQAELDLLFNSYTGNLELNGWDGWRDERPRVHRLTRQARRPHEGVIRIPKRPSPTLLRTGLSNSDLASFDVFKYLADLSSAYSSEASQGVEELLRAT